MVSSVALAEACKQMAGTASVKTEHHAKKSPAEAGLESFPL